MKEDYSAPSTNETLLIKLRNPLDANAWQLFVDLYTPMIFRYGRQRGLQEADACDVVQDVLTRVSRSIRNFEYDPDRGQFRAWLGTISRRVVLDCLRKNIRLDRAPGNGADHGLLDALEGENDPLWLDAYKFQLLRMVLRRIRGEFASVTWEAFEQTWLQHQTVSVVANNLNQTAAWVYKARYIVLTRMKAELKFLAEDIRIFQRD